MRVGHRQALIRKPRSSNRSGFFCFFWQKIFLCAYLFYIIVKNHLTCGVDVLEKKFENALYSARWLLAPIYCGLSLALIALGVKFFQEIFHTIPMLFEMKEADLVLVILSLIDLSLVGGLLVMIMFSGYENFVSRLDIYDESEKLSWLGKMDSTGLKNKVAVSIVAISSIHLLKVFMNAENIGNDKILWYVILHMTFVGSAFAMGLLDKVSRNGNEKGEKTV